MPALPTIAAYGAGLLATLVLAAFLTPRSWWRRANARALAVLTLGTLGIGTVLSGFVAPITPAQAEPLAAAPAHPDLPQAGAAYRTWDDLNLRDGRSVGARRLGVVPAGTMVTATGRQLGDWWEINARINGHDAQGWANSLWLRRPGEQRK